MLNGVITTFPASAETIKAASNNTYGSYHPLTAIRQHHAVFYGLAKAAGDVTQQESDNDVGAYTDAAKTAIRAMLGAASVEDIPSVPVEDVQLNGTSVLQNGVANIPYATQNTFGVTAIGDGLQRSSSNKVMICCATVSQTKAGLSAYYPICPNTEHAATFYGLAKAAGDGTQSQSENAVGIYTDAAKIAIRAMLGVPSVDDIPSVPVGDVQLNGVSVVSEGIANVPCANANILGVVQTEAEYGITIMSGTQGKLRVQQASAAQVRAGQQAYKPIVPANQHTAVFYGLAAAAGDTTQSQSANAVGSYTDEAKAAVRAMLGLDDLSILAIVENGLPAAEGVEW